MPVSYTDSSGISVTLNDEQSSNVLQPSYATTNDVVTETFTLDPSVAGATVTVTNLSINGVDVTANVVPIAGDQYSVTYTVQANDNNGPADISIKATDSTGATLTSPNEPGAITVDTYVPTTTQGAEVSSNPTATLAKAADIITETFAASDTVTNVTIDGNAASVVNNLDGTYTATYTVQPADLNGPANVVVTQQDAAGFSTSNTIPGSVTVDTVAPQAFALGDWSVTNASVSLAKAGDLIWNTIYVQPESQGIVTGVTVNGHGALVSPSAEVNSYYVRYWVPVGDTNGPATFVVTTLDPAGNVGTTSLPSGITIDTVAPVVTLSGEASNNATTTLAKAGDTITETFTSTDTVASVTIDGQAATVVHGLGDNYTATYTVLSGDTNGAAAVSVTATDAAGNTTTVTDPGTVMVDTHAPTVAITSAGGFTNQAGQTITGTGEAGTTVTILDGATTLGTATVAGDGTWTSNVTLSGYGSHSVTATDADAAGNVGTSATDSITLMHPVTITSTGGSTNQLSQTITGTGEAGTVVTVFDGATSLGTTTVAGDGTWSDHVTLVNSAGAHVVTATESALPVYTSNNLMSINGYGVLQGSIIADAQGNLYGATSGLGSAQYPSGAFFEIDAATHTFTVLADFNGSNSSTPLGPLVADSNGNIYGEANSGGYGSVYEYSPTTHTLTTIAQFNVGLDPFTVAQSIGIAPSGGLTLDSSGNLYGAIPAGGTYGNGAVFEIDAASHTLTTLVNFDASGVVGAFPAGAVTSDAAGNLYGTTTYTAANPSVGTVFEVAAGTGAVTTLTTFDGVFGNSADAGVVLDAHGNIYGESSSGGSAGDGTIFEIDATTHAGKALVSFDGGANGGQPEGGLVQDQSGNLFGVTVFGGANGTGTVFEIDATTHALTTIASNPADVTPPLSVGITQDANGNLYVETVESNGLSVINELTPIQQGVTETSSAVTYTVAGGGLTLTQGSEVSGNAGNNAFAKAGDVVTETFTLDTSGVGATVTVDSVTINGVAASSVTHIGDAYTATYTVSGADQNGAADIHVAAHDSVGNSISSTVAGTVTIDTIAPNVVLGGESSSNTTNTLAIVGDTITETFSSTDTVTGVTIGGQAATVHNLGSGDYTATYVVRASDSDGSADVVVTAHDAAGNVTTQSNSGSVTIDTDAPVVNLISEWSSNATPVVAVAGDTITETFLSSDTVTGVTIAGHAAAVENLGGNIYFATYTVQSGDTSGSANVVVTAQNAVGNVTIKSDPGSVTIDTYTPVITLSGETSSNPNPAYAKAGDTITESFTSTDTVTGVTIDGQAATVHSLGGNNYSATYTVQAGDTNGTADVSVTSTEAAGNSTTATATGDVTIDTHAPTVAITSSGGFTNQAGQTITGTGEAGTTVTILDGATTLGTATVAGDGTWTSNVTLSGYGPHNLTATDADAAGNVGTSAADSITLAHPVTITSSGSLTNQPQQTVSGTGEAGTTVTVFDGSTALGSTTVAGDGTWTDSVTLTNAQGSHSISATESASGGTPSLTTLLNFSGNLGGLPASGLTADSHGNFYGTTTSGGSYGWGTLYEVDATTHAVTTLINFDRGALGGDVSSQPFIDTNGNVYGTAQYGGATDKGTVWEYNPTTHAATTLANLSWPTGYQPVGGVVVDGAGDVYGTAVNGGWYGGGILYEIPASTHTLTTLVNFNANVNGSAPYGSLTIGGDGNLYGTTQTGGNGGPWGTGTLFELNATTHALTTLVNFDGANGSNAPVGLITGSDGNVYGSTQLGGANNAGALFELNVTTHALTTLASFDGANGGGVSPGGTLLRDASGNLFGTTVIGGANNEGTIFEYNAATHALTTLASFNDTNGAIPLSNLVADASGNLYGTTQFGGSSHGFSSRGDGTLFELSGLVNNLSTSGAVTYTLDSVTPALGGALESSNNVHSTSLAKAGDTITETFTLDASVGGVAVTIDSVTIDGQSAVFTSLGGDQYSASVTVGSGFANGTADLAVTAHDSAGNSGTDTVTGTVIVDTGAPVVTLTGEASSNNTTTLAKAGDTITETFTSTDTVTGVTIDGNAATVHHGAGNNYSATYVVQSNDANGTADVSVTSQDAAGNTTTVSATGSVTIDTQAPLVSLTSEVSNNAHNTQAAAGDTITETFTSTDTVTGVTIDGQAATVHSLGGDNYSATYTVQSGDANGTADVVVTSHDAAGNITTQSASGSVTVDTVAPTVGLVGESSDNATTTLAKPGDTITETITSTDPVTAVTIDGNAATVHHGAGNNYSATYVVQSNDANGTADVSVTSQDAAGNTTMVSATGSVTIDTVAPVVHLTSEVSNNATTTLAKAGDVITEFFTSTDTVTGVTIDGQAATVVQGLGNNYTATYTVLPGDHNGAAAVQVTSHDAAGNVTTVSDGGSVVVDTIAPIVVDGGEASNNHNSEALAKPGDVITESFTVTSTDTVDGVTIDGQTATLNAFGAGNYTATYTVLSGDPSGPAGVVISAHDAAGNVTVDPIAGSVTVASTVPTASLSFDESTNADSTIATTGDHIQEVFHLASATPGVGVTIDSVTVDGQSASPIWFGANDYGLDYVTKVTDPGGVANVVLHIHDDAGNTNVVTLGGAVTVDTLPPTITQVSDASNNPHPTWARAGNVITESFTLDPEVAGVPVFVDSVTIDGQAATVVHGLGDQYTATYTVQSSDANGAAAIQILTHDEAGNIASLTLEGDVTVDTIAPTVTVDGSTETSNNANSNLLAKAGDVITETFTSTDIVTGVTIDGQNATVVNNGGNNYTATYTVQSGIHQGTADIVVSSTDIAGNTTVRSSPGAVTVDTIAPNVGIITPPVGVISTQGQTLLGYGEAGTPLQIFENGRLLYSITVDNSGRWSQVLTLDTSGPNTLTVTDTDPAGNIGYAILPYDVVPVHGLEAERALQTTVVKGTQQWVWQDLLSGAVDADATSPSLAVTGLTFSVNGGAASANAPAGVQLVGNQLMINPTNSAFAGVTAGNPETIVAHYTISDGHGGNLAQTDTITIVAPAGNPAVVYDHAPTVAAALHTTVERGGQAQWAQLLAGAADLDGNTLNVQDVTFSVNGAASSATVPTGIQIANNQIYVDPNNAAFAGIASGQSETIVVHYNIADGFGGQVAQTDTVTVLAPAAPAVPVDHAPTVQGALNTTAMVGLQAVWGRLLDGASDVDAGNVLHAQDLTFSINGAAASATVPGGIQIANDQILVDPNNAAFAGIASGHSETIVVNYNISDGHGGLVAQTDTVTIDGPAPNPALAANHAPTVAEALDASVTRGGSAQWVQLLAGASDLDNNALHATNVTYSVNGGAFSATVPGGLQFANDQLLVDPNNAAFAGLGNGQSETIAVHYNVTDGMGGSVAQTDTITVLGQASDHATNDHAPTVSQALSTTVVAGQQGILNSLLAGATDVDGDPLSVANVTYSVNGGAFTSSAPSGVSVGNGLVQVLGLDPSFASLGAGQSETIVMHYNITDGRGGSVAQSETITVEGPAGNPAIVNNHAPTVAAALTDVLTVGQQGAMENLLAGALDADGNVLHATNVTYSVNGGAASANVPAGVTVYPDQLLVDPNNAAFAGLATGQHETILVSYNVNDGHGGLTAQTDTITVRGPLAAAAVAADVTPPVLTGAVSLTAMVGTQSAPASLLAGAYDADGDVLHTANVTYSVNGGAASAVAPAGVTVYADQLTVDPNNAAFAALTTGQHETITLGYDVLDSHGNSVHQTAAVTVNGPAASPVLVHDNPPTVAAALTAETMVGTQNENWLNLLEGASDADGNVIHVANVTFSVNGGAFSATVPSGVTVNGDVMTVNQNDSSFASLGAGQSDTIVARYNIVDGIGGSTVQTDTVTVEGATNRHYLDLAGQTLTSTGHADVFVASVLDGAPTSAGGNVDTILNFNAAAGDRIDLSGLLSSTTSVHSTVSLNAYTSDSSMLSVSVAGTEYYIAKVQGVDLSVPQAVGDLSTLNGSSWTDTIDVTSAHGGPATVTAGAHATLTGAVANAGGDWTIQVVSGTATEDAATHQLVFSTPSSGNEVIIHTADGLNHDLTNVTSVVWHA